MNGLRRTQCLLGRDVLSLGRPATLRSRHNELGLVSTAVTPLCRCGAPAAAAAVRSSQRWLSLSAARSGRGDHSNKAAAGAGGKKASRDRDRGGGEDNGGEKHPQAKADPADAFNFSDVEAAWARADEYHRSKLLQLRGRGRFGADAIGQLAVAVAPAAAAGKESSKKTAAAAAGQTVRLDELAVVVPTRGRTVEIRMHDPASRKAIMSAVQASADFNQQPQADPDNELVLFLKVEIERADDQVRRARELAHEWRDHVRHATHRRQKLHQAWKKDKAVVVDAAHRLDKELAKLQDGALAKIDAVEKDTVREINARQQQGAF